jgi:hypothetical protein
VLGTLQQVLRPKEEAETVTVYRTGVFIGHMVETVYTQQCSNSGALKFSKNLGAT